MRHHLGQLGHRIQQLVGHPVGMRGQEADPLQAFDLVQHAQQAGQVRAIRDVFAVAVDDLAEQGDLFDTLCDQARTSARMSPTGRLRSMPRR